MSSKLLKVKDGKTSFHVLGFCTKCVMGLCLTVFLSGCFSSYVVSVSPRVRDSDIDKSKICPATVEVEELYSVGGPWKHDKFLYAVSEGDRPGTAALILTNRSTEHSESNWITIYHICTLGILPIPNDNDTISYELGGRLPLYKALAVDSDVKPSDDAVNIEWRVYKCGSLFPTAYIPALVGLAMGDDVYVRFLGFGKDDVEFMSSIFAEHVKKHAAAHLTKHGDKIPVRRETDQERAERINHKERKDLFPFRRFLLGVNAMGGTK